MTDTDGRDAQLTWAAFETAAPRLAEVGRRLLDREAAGPAFLATVRHDDLPRIHPISVAVLDDRLCAFILRSPKRTDLVEDGRYALHTRLDDAVPYEFAVRGRAVLIEDEAVRSAIGGKWFFEPDETYFLFEFLIHSAVIEVRESADEWPPRYTTWAAEPG